MNYLHGAGNGTTDQIFDILQIACVRLYFIIDFEYDYTRGEPKYGNNESDWLNGSFRNTFDV